MKCKVINSSKKGLESEVNEWLESENPVISNVLQTESDSNGYITLTIFYYTKNEVRAKKLEKIENSVK